jgi:hypothetical protein
VKQRAVECASLLEIEDGNLNMSESVHALSLQISRGSGNC